MTFIAALLVQILLLCVCNIKNRKNEMDQSFDGGDYGLDRGVRKQKTRSE